MPGSGIGGRPQMAEQEFLEWAELLERSTGIRWPNQQRSFLETRLRMRMRELGLDSFRVYYDYLLARGTGHQEWGVLLDQLTIHESRFFRHRPSFDLIQEALLQRNRQAFRFLRCWSVGCATGEEPYTMAMLLHQHLQGGLGEGGDFRVLGTDISVAALAKARAGVFEEGKVADIPQPLRRIYLRREGRASWRFAKEIRQRIVFLEGNVAGPSARNASNMDLIMCQNVLIYFGEELRQRILERLAGCLGEGGTLVLGPGEVVHWRHPLLERVTYPNTLAFRRAAISSRHHEGTHG